MYNELLNSRTNEQAEKLVDGAWQPMGMLEKCVGAVLSKFCDVAALKRQL